MKRLLQATAVIASLVPASPALAALNVGDPAPDFSSQAVQGDAETSLRLSDLLQSGPVVVFFLPYVFSGASAAECREFAANMDAFRAAGASVVGMSRDSLEDLAHFSADQCAGVIPMASADFATVTDFDVNDSANFATRTTYVIAPSGEIAFVHDDDNPRGHVGGALAFLRQMPK